MRKGISIFLFLLLDFLLLPVLKAQTLNQQDSLAFISRRQAVLNLFDANPSTLASCTLKQAGYLIGAQVAKGSSTSEINTFALRLIQNGNEQQLLNRGFDYLPLMDSYIRWNSYFTDATKNAFKQFFLTQSSYKTPGSYNEMLMFATARFLVGQVWGESNLPDSTTFQTGDSNAKKYLMRAMNNLVFSGMGEYGSDPYAPYSMVCFLTLADLSTDLELKNRAIITYETILAQSIAPSLQGNYMAATGRSYPDVKIGDTQGTMIESFLWPYLGVGGLPRNVYIVLLPCLSTYRIPNNLVQLAINRNIPMVAKTNFQGKFQYSYLNKNYGIYSERELTSSTFYQKQRSGVLWVNSDPTKNNLLWVTHPMYDDLTYVPLRHTHGMTYFERVAQYNGTTVHTYNIPNVATQMDGALQMPVFKYALGWVPGSYLAKINESDSFGRIFLHYGKVLIAITASNKFCWKDSIPAPTYNNILDVKTGDSQFHVEGLQFGLAIETADPADYVGNAQSQLSAFRSEVLKHNISYDSSSLSTTYTDRAGNVISCAFNGGDKINNTVVAYNDSWGFLNCNGITQFLNQNLTVIYKDQKTVYDFLNWNVSRTTIGTGLDFYKENNAMRFFVDAHEQLTIRFNNADGLLKSTFVEVEICALDGRLLYKANVVLTDDGLATVSLSGFSKGIYICRLKTEQGIITSKFCK